MPKSTKNFCLNNTNNKFVDTILQIQKPDNFFKKKVKNVKVNFFFWLNFESGQVVLNITSKENEKTEYIVF